jgi:hypothetical protein
VETHDSPVVYQILGIAMISWWRSPPQLKVLPFCSLYRE